jgi:hypothetical protein
LVGAVVAVGGLVLAWYYKREACGDRDLECEQCREPLIRIPDVLRHLHEMATSKDQRTADAAPRAMRAQMREATTSPL